MQLPKRNKQGRKRDNQVRSILRREKHVKAKAIARELGCSTWTINICVRSLRMQGERIASTHQGYYWKPKDVSLHIATAKKAFCVADHAMTRYINQVTLNMKRIAEKSKSDEEAAMMLKRNGIMIACQQLVESA